MVASTASSLSNNDNTHGGATAIGGFVYQILATTSDQVTAEKSSGADPYSDAVIYVHEALDQDVAKVSTLTNKVKLIQAKYSINGAQNKIDATELDDIVNRLLKAAKSAIDDGLKVTKFQLVSNRGLNGPAKKKLALCRRNAKKNKFRPSNPTKNGILGTLDEISLTEAEMRKRLDSFGESFGLKGVEIEDGIDRLTGKIFAGVARNKAQAMGISGLREIFVGNKNAKRITRSSMSQQSTDELAKITSEKEGNHISRKHAEDILVRNPNRAVFVFLGQGGMGKTASLRNLMELEVKSPHGSLLRAGKGSKIEIDWANKCIVDWRGASRYPVDNLLDSVERLKIANPKTGPPILTLALDGVDEGVKEGHEDYITALIRQLVSIDKDSSALPGKIPEIRLLVTCREEEEFTRFLDTDISGLELEIEPPAKGYEAIMFGPFTPEEFLMAVKADELELIDKIFQIAKRVAGMPTSAAGPAPGAVPPIYPHLEFLCDPLIWRVFTTLGEKDKMAVLTGKPAGQKKLGAVLLKRFCQKTEARCSWKRSKKLEEILQSLASKFRRPSNKRNRPNFIKEAGKLGLAFEECDRLFDEAINGGLITGGKTSWVWRHRVIELALGI
jgi:hypothetical protein